jgi:hypothetical protein
MDSAIQKMVLLQRQEIRFSEEEKVFGPYEPQQQQQTV